MTLLDLFPEDDYRFQMRFERQVAGEFFRPTSQHEQILVERRHWLATDAENCLATLPEADPLIEETLQFARAETNLQPATCSPRRSEAKTGNVDPSVPLANLGASWEPDFLLLKLDSTNRVRLLAGCVCFPSSWSLTEKIGFPIEHIHGVVPGLNAAIGPQIHTFLSKLRPGTAWLRANWGLSRSPELNQHPARKLPKLDAQVKLEEVSLRIEHQALVSLPRTQGVLFGIRIAVHPLAKVRDDRMLAERFIRALKTIPDEMARYKNIAAAKPRIIDLLA
jgi:hypothetical protein